MSASASVGVVSVDPWTFGAGEARGDQMYLSFPNAARWLSQRLANHTGAALALAVAGVSMDDFAGQLQAFNAVFPTPNLQRIQRRAAAMAQLAESKMQLVPHQTFSQQTALNGLPRVRQLMRADLIKAAADAAESFKTATTANHVTALQTAKTAHAAMVSGVQAAAQAGLSGGNGWLCYSASNIAGALLQGHPSSDLPLCTIQVFTGSVADLAYLRGLFN